MGGIPEFNFPLFDEVAASLRAQGHEVWSPADHDRERDPFCEQHPSFASGTLDHNFDWYAVIKEDVRAVTEQDAIALLPGWEASKGAKIERGVAEDCNIPIYLCEDNDGDWNLVVEPRPLIVGLSGWAQHGKDTVGQVLGEYGFKRRSFADKLRDLAEYINPTITALPGRIDDIRQRPLQWWLNAHGYEWTKNNTDYRDFLINLGNGARQLIGPDVWVDSVDFDAPKMVFTDVRYQNEAKAIKDRGGIMIRVVRLDEDGEPIPTHDGVSEHDLDEYPFDIIIYNVSSVEALQDTVRGLAEVLEWDHS